MHFNPMNQNSWLLRFFLIAAVLIPAFSWAGMSVEFNKDRIEAGKEFQLILVIPHPELPQSRGVPTIDDLQGFTLSRVDSADERINSFFTGRMMVRKYRYHMTAPRKDGSYRLPLSWEMDGQTRSLGNVRIDVARPYDASGLQVRLTPSKKAVYEGEQLSLTMSLQTFENFQGGLNLSGIDLGNDFVAHRSDLGKLQLVRSSQPGVQMEANAKIAWLSPIRPGNLTIPPLQFKYQKMGEPKVVNKQMGNMSFSSVSQQPEEATATSGAVQIQAMPLPTEGKPAHFDGMVGQYTFEAKLDRTQLQVGEALTLFIKIRGNGKPGSIPDPQLPSFGEFRSVPPESQVSKTEINGVIWTERTLKIFLYPKKKGSFHIAPVRFAWFDPTKRKYIEGVSEEFQIQVEKGELTEAAASGGTTVAAMLTTTEKKAIEQLGQDIRFIHEPESLPQEYQGLYRKFWYWGLLILPLIAAIFLAMWSKRKQSLLQDRGYQRRTHAQHSLLAIWAEAEVAVAKNDTRLVLALIERGLVAYLGDLFNQELTGLTRDRLKLTLLNASCPAEAVDELLRLLAICDQARFSPMGIPQDEATQMLSQAKKLSDSLGRA